VVVATSAGLTVGSGVAASSAASMEQAETSSAKMASHTNDRATLTAGLVRG